MRISDWSSDVCSSDLKAFRRIRWVCNNIDIHDRSALDALIARRRDEAAEAERIRKRDALQKALDQERKRKAKQDRDEVRRAKARDSAWNHKLSVAKAELERMKYDAQFFAEQRSAERRVGKESVCTVRSWGLR